MLLSQAASANIITIILYVVVFGAIIYFMMIRPQKKQQKEGELTEDDLKGELDEVQKKIEKAVKEIDSIVAAKDKEIMEV